VGKTTLSLEIAKEISPSLYLDLESERDRVKLTEPEDYLGRHLDKLVILDEVHRAPALFPVLRGLVDRALREGRGKGRYLLLGSAALALLKQSGESLAGRIRFMELTPFTVEETPVPARDDLWLRGGFPPSFLAGTDAESLRWRHDFIRTYLERDIPQFGPRIPAETLRRFWTMLAHRQGASLNVAELARGLDVDVKTAHRYVDLLVDLLLARRLMPWKVNVAKRLVKAPRLFLRDSGILHALLGIGDHETLVAHPVVGASWEGFVVEQILSSVPAGVDGYYYRTAGGAEIDLLLAWPEGRIWAIEIKRNLTPRIERGFYAGCADVNPERRYLVYPGTESFPAGSGIEVVPLDVLTTEVRKAVSRSPGI